MTYSLNALRRYGLHAVDVFRFAWFALYGLALVSLRLLLGRQRRNRLLARTGFSDVQQFQNRIGKIFRSIEFPVETPFGVAFLRPFSYDPFHFSWTHEPEVTEFIIKQGFRATCVDIGACGGRYTLILSKTARKVIAIEPHPENYRILKMNAALYHKTDYHTVRCVYGAISNYTGKATLYIGSHEGGHSLRKISSGRLVVPVYRLQDIVGGDECEFVKVDVEGSEFEVLEGAISTSVRSWLVEFHDSKRKEELESLFIKNGYRSQRWIDSNHLFAVKG